MRYPFALLLIGISACSTPDGNPDQAISAKNAECKNYAASLLNINRNNPSAQLEKRERRHIEIDYVIRCHKAHIYKLYTDAMLTQANPSGEVSLHLSISKSGDVTAIQIDTTDLQNKIFLNKLIAYIKQLKFNKAKSDGSYPYTIAFAE